MKGCLPSQVYGQRMVKITKIIKVYPSNEGLSTKPGIWSMNGYKVTKMKGYTSNEGLSTKPVIWSTNFTRLQI